MPRRPSARDKWSRKQWFTVYAPPAFNFREIAHVPADEPKKLLNRVVETTLYDLTGDISLLHVKLRFQIVHVVDSKAFTQFKGHELARDYIRSIVRRGSTKVDGHFDVETKDGAYMRVTAMALTMKRCKSSQEKAIRRIMNEVISSKAKVLDFDAFIQEAVLGKIASEIFNNAKKIYPLRKTEIVKIKVLKMPSVDFEAIAKEILSSATATTG
ncbi:MAG: 30S ribosomal protein S3ae [Thermoprotei archaeon]|nr:MAG: 30S ribosomal protein S3ae [Thermoprotei archaeon]RLF25046.1 MAG: 30S ribosomal protein S3ae [Thermoprotei archaeon]